MATSTRLNKWSIIILDLGGGHYRTDVKPIIRSPLLAKKKETTSLSRSRIEEYAGAFLSWHTKAANANCLLIEH